MAVIASWSGAGLADGTTVTTSTVGTGDTAFTTVTASAFTVQAAGLHPPRIQMDQAAATAAELIWDSTVVGTTLTTWAARLYTKLSAYPPSNGGRLISAYTSAGALLWFIDLTTAGLLRLRNAGGSAVSTSAGALSTTNTLRIEAVHNNGNVTVNVYTGDGGTVAETVSATGLGTGSALEAIRFGMPATSPTWPRLWMDEMALANTAAEIGPSSGPSGTGSISATATLSGTGTKQGTGTGTASGTGSLAGAGGKAASGSGSIAAAATLTGIGAPPVVTAPDVPAFIPGVPVGSLPSEFNAKIRDPFTALLKPPVFRARRTTALTVAENTAQAVTWNSTGIDEDPYGGWASGQPTRWTVPTGWGGWWHVTAAVSLSGTGAAGLVLIPSISVNGGATLPTGVLYEGQEVFVPTGAGQQKVVSSSWWVYAAAGDYLELVLYYSAESAITAVDTGAGSETRLELIWDGI